MKGSRGPGWLVAAKPDWWWGKGGSVGVRPPPQGEGKGGVGAALPTQSFPRKRRASFEWDSCPYLPCRLHLHRELGRGKESRGWMQSLGMHGAQGGLWRRESGPEAAWGRPLAERCP